MKGHIQQRGTKSWRLKFDIGRDPDTGARIVRQETVRGSKREAQDRLNAILAEIKQEKFIDRSTTLVKDWVESWITLRTGKVNARTIERYAQLLRLHVVPTLGERRLQTIRPKDIDTLYASLAPKLAARTIHHVHVVLGACLATAVRKGEIRVNPVANADAPATGDEDAATVLDEEQLAKLLNVFRGSTLYPIVVFAALTGARRNEILALPWSDVDFAAKTVTIARALEETKAFGVRFKDSKTERGKRTITIDDGLVELLRAERETHWRLMAGVPDGVNVDLSLVKLTPDALVFPSPAPPIDLTKPRDARGLTKEFIRRAGKLGFKGLRFHDLRASHETALLDRGEPVHVVAARCGHDAAVMLRVYAKRTKKADTRAAATIGALSKVILGA